MPITQGHAVDVRSCMADKCIIWGVLALEYRRFATCHGFDTQFADAEHPRTARFRQGFCMQVCDIQVAPCRNTAHAASTW